jgi:hypothetical protein
MSQEKKGISAGGGGKCTLIFGTVLSLKFNKLGLLVLWECHIDGVRGEK